MLHLPSRVDEVLLLQLDLALCCSLKQKGWDCLRNRSFYCIKKLLWSWIQQLVGNTSFLFKMVLSCVLMSNYFALLLLLKERNPLCLIFSASCSDTWRVSVHSFSNTCPCLVSPSTLQNCTKVLVIDYKYMKSHLSSVFCSSLLIPSPNFLKSQGFAMLFNTAVVSILLPHHCSPWLCLAFYNGISLFSSRNITAKYVCM